MDKEQIKLVVLFVAVLVLIGTVYLGISAIIQAVLGAFGIEVSIWLSFAMLLLLHYIAALFTKNE